MEIGIEKRGDLQILSVSGKIRLQNWRVLDKHLESLLAKDCKWLVMDLSGVTLICSTGIGSILHNVRKFQEHESKLLLISTTAYIQELFQTFGCEAFLGDIIFRDWELLHARLQSQGLQLTR